MSKKYLTKQELKERLRQIESSFDMVLYLDNLNKKIKEE